MVLAELVSQNMRDARHLGFRYPLRHLAALLGRPEYECAIRRFGPVRFRPVSSDAGIIRQIARDRDYDISRFPQSEFVERHYADLVARSRVPLILDAGANIGISSRWLASQYPEARVVALEPDPQNAALCRHNTRNVPSISVIEGAIGGSSGQVHLRNPTGEAWAVTTSRTGGGGVRLWTVDDLLAFAGDECELFIVKVDIEGFEEDLFGANLDWLGSVAVLIIEPHDWLFPGRGSSHAFQAALANAHFDMLLAGENLVYVRSDLMGPEPAGPTRRAAR